MSAESSTLMTSVVPDFYVSRERDSELIRGVGSPKRAADVLMSLGTRRVATGRFTKVLERFV